MLTPIDTWTSINPNKGEYTDNNGNGLCGTWQRDVDSSSETLILSNGHIANQFKYPKISHMPFQSPMVRWQNLYFNWETPLIDKEGQTWNQDKHLIDAVCSGLKPIGFVTCGISEISEYLKQIEKAGLHCEISAKPLKKELNTNTDKYTNELQYNLGVANAGAVEDLFDLEKFKAAYRALATGAFKRYVDLALIFTIGARKTRLSELIKDPGSESMLTKKRGKYGNINKVGQFIFESLVLGYPIEATISVLMQQGYNKDVERYITETTQEKEYTSYVIKSKGLAGTEEGLNLHKPCQTE